MKRHSATADKSYSVSIYKIQYVSKASRLKGSQIEPELCIERKRACFGMTTERSDPRTWSNKAKTQLMWQVDPSLSLSVII